jgi:ornithine cyclodeaminase
MSTATGEVLALLYDEGWLTNLRTAIAGAVAIRAIARPMTRTLGVMGSGVQARMQGKWIARLLGIERTLVWARDKHKAAILAKDLTGISVELSTLTRDADLIVTTTASTTPVLTSELVRPGARIVAVGADAPGKQELDTGLTASATLIVNSVEQCADYGKVGWAIRAGIRRRSDF